MKITLAFKKNEINSKFCFDCKLIQLWTKSKFYHVEMIINDMWVSSNPSSGGVTIKPLQPLTDNWEYIEINVDGRKLKKVMFFIESQKDSKYDWVGMLVNNIFESNITFEDKNKWFCSEIVSHIMKIFEHKLFKDVTPSKTSPGSLYKLIFNS